MSLLDPHIRNLGMTPAQGWLFTILYLHCNSALRCWPGDRLLMTEVGMTTATIQKHRNFLIEHGALLLVPVEQRMTSEAHLPVQKYVYQITGVYLKAPGVWLPTIQFQTPEALESHIEIIKALESETALISKALTALISKALISKAEVVKKPLSRKSIKSTTPASAGGRERDPIFDDIQQNVFRIALTVKVDKTAGARIGLISSWCKKNAVTLEELKRFYSWYRTVQEYKNCALPLDRMKFAGAFLKFRTCELNGKGKALARYQNPSDDPRNQTPVMPTPEEQAEVRRIIQKGRPNE